MGVVVLVVLQKNFHFTVGMFTSVRYVILMCDRVTNSVMHSS